MTNEQKIISELREFLETQAVCFRRHIDISGNIVDYAQTGGQLISTVADWTKNDLINQKLTELEQKYCNKVVETDKRVYACSDCGHPHKLEDLILLDSELEQGKTK